jgi:heavy metal translocating P-type ATPase
MYVVSIIAMYIVSQNLSVPAYFVYVPLVLAWFPLVWVAIQDLRKKQIGTEFFLVFATIFALIGHEEHAIMIVLIIMLIARYAELFIENQTKRALESIIRLIPTHVMVRSGNEEVVMPLRDVQIGMHIIIATGARVPVDGVVIEGCASINEASLTGESVLQEKQVGNSVFAGTFVEAGSIVIEAQKIKEETLFGRMVVLLVQAEKDKAAITILTDRIVQIFTPLYLIFIVLIWLITRDFDTVLTLLIFGSPLELALVTPLTVLAGTVAAFRHGILVKSGRALESLAQIDTIIFDKTGTLTLGEPSIVHVQSYISDISNNEIIRLAAMAEKRSDHVVAKALVAKAKEEHIVVPLSDKYTSVVGHGVEVEYQGTHYFFGNKHFIEAPEHGNSLIPLTAPVCLDEKLHSNFYLAAQGRASHGRVLGKICMADAIRPEAKDIIQELLVSGIKNIMLLSGDRQEITDTIAQQLDIHQRYGGMFPDQKLTMLKKMQQEGHVVAMVGDGINDVAALKQAHVGIALGAMGMEPAIDAADVVLMTNDLQKIFFVRRLAQKVFRVIQQNLIIGFLFFHILGLVLTLMHIVTPTQAAFAHAISDIFIVINASRLIYFK